MAPDLMVAFMALVCFVIGIIGYQFLKLFVRFYIEELKKEAETKRVSEVSKSNLGQRFPCFKFGGVIGTYSGKEIYERVMAGGREYVFESVAVEIAPGVYHSPDTKHNHIVVDGSFLYRESFPAG